jgi:hypothetical protein
MMGWPGRRRAYIAPIVVVEPSKFGPDAVLVLEWDGHLVEKEAASLKTAAQSAFGMKVVVLTDGLKVARVDCGVMEKKRRRRA